VLAQSLSALVQIVCGATLAVSSYPGYLRALAGYDAARAQVDTAGSFVLGATAFVGFFFTWRGIVALVLFAEGLVRLLGAAAGIEVGTSAGWLVRRIRDTKPQNDEIVPPEVVTLDGEVLIIDSARPRLLEPTNVLDHDGRDFICDRVEPGSAPRAHRYVLRPLRDGEVVRRRVRRP